jgi:hypothetical protein
MTSRVLAYPPRVPHGTSSNADSFRDLPPNHQLSRLVQHDGLASDFLVLLDVPSRSVQLAMVHPEAVPAALAPLLPALPGSLDGTTLDALLALRLPHGAPPRGISRRGSG